MKLIATRIAIQTCVFGWLCSCTFLSQDSKAYESNEAKWKPAEPQTKPEEFGLTIRSTPWRTPEEERQGFHLPTGFEIDLVAAEPAISKPMNMAFDAKGRLWITQSSQYPFPAKEGTEAVDAILVLEDRDRNGSFESVTTFASGLNIPIGILPVEDGVICFSIPNLLLLKDTDRDGICDKREVILGPFDTSRDTHGMVNSLRLGSDGWVYACHGFNNQSKVAAKDGSTVEMTSGNTFRFRPDGSRVEHYTRGQVNPFGMTSDEWGFWYAADCHSKPISQLIRGGCYPSFARPDDGLGFVPPMMNHLHGSTAISGLAHTRHSSFPLEMKDNFVSGNVMTCRINRNRIEYSGATAKAVAMPDLLTSEDSWFRPVDLQFGPDGCLYIADFYNKIIGHYEVPLDHPDRDRKSGRIWRIRWTGTEPKKASSEDSTDTKLTDALIQRKEILHQISILELTGNLPSTEERLSKWIDASTVKTDLPAKIDSAMVIQAMAELVSTVEKLRPTSPWIQPSIRSAAWILDQIERVDKEKDPVLFQSLLISLHSCLQSIRTRGSEDHNGKMYEGWLRSTVSQALTRSQNGPRSRLGPVASQAWVRALLASKDTVSAEYVLSILEHQTDLQYSGRNEKDPFWDSVAESLFDRLGGEFPDRVLALFEEKITDSRALADKLVELSERPSLSKKSLEVLAKRCFQVAESIADALLKKAKSEALLDWTARGTKQDDLRPWKTETRKLSSDLPETGGSENGLFFSSFTRGEEYVGSWTSSPFVAPKAISFYVVGHNGLPATEDSKKNYVALQELDFDGSVLREIFRQYPPRNDSAARVKWNLEEYAGRTVQIQVVDADAAKSYAWIGVGRFSMSSLDPCDFREDWGRVVQLVRLSPKQPIAILDGGTSGARSSARFKPSTEKSIANPLSSVHLLSKMPSIDWSLRAKLQLPILRDTNPLLADLNEFVLEQRWMDMQSDLDLMLGTGVDWDWSNIEKQKIEELAINIAKRCSASEQERLVTRLSRNQLSWTLLEALCEKGVISPSSLAVLPESFWGAVAAAGRDSLTKRRPTGVTQSERQELVAKKAAALVGLQPDLDAGKKHFVERCASCHKLGELGKVVGPQLEGIGNRGIPRLCEDILWPDRNVDEAFRMTLILLDDGETLNGLVQNDNNSDTLLVTDQTGKQRKVLKSEVERQKRSELSLMPGNFEELMTDQELASLIGFLRSEARK